MWKSGERASFTLDGWGGCECGPIALVANVAPVDSAFVWHDWRPFLVVGSRVGGVEEIAGGQGRLGEVAGVLRAPSPQSAPAFPDFFAGCSGGFCLGERGGRPSGRRAVIHGIGSASALVFQVDSESAENAFENQGAIGFPAAQGGIPPIAKIFIVEQSFLSPVWPLCPRSAPAPVSIFSACSFLAGRPQVMSLSTPSRRVGSDPSSPLND